MEKVKTYWLSYDLGVGGDYKALYQWLDNQGAKLCGDSVAFFKYKYDEAEDPDEKLKAELLSHVQLKGGNKLYIIRINGKKEPIGSFIYGKRSAAPWVGYGSQNTEVDD